MYGVVGAEYLTKQEESTPPFRVTVVTSLDIINDKTDLLASPETESVAYNYSSQFPPGGAPSDPQNHRHKARNVALSCGETGVG